MTLKEEIDKYKQKSAGKASPAMVEVMQRCTAELQASTANRKIPKAGDTMPAFSLADSEGKQVESAKLLATGPVVVTFFRGMW